jgi:hypothetical protein
MLGALEGDLCEKLSTGIPRQYPNAEISAAIRGVAVE